jgi:hypothetical protein
MVQTIDTMERKLKIGIENTQSLIAKFATSFQADPHYTLSWGDSTVQAVCRFQVYQQVLAVLRSAQSYNRISCSSVPREPGAIAMDMSEFVLEQIKQSADRVPSSTSHMSNLVENFTRAAWVECYKQVILGGF